MIMKLLEKIMRGYSFDAAFDDEDVPEPAVTTDSYVTILRER